MALTRFVPAEYFSPQELAQIRSRSNVRGIGCVIHAWAVIAAAMTLYAAWPNPLTFVAAVVVIGSRQLGLAILMHDAAHGVLTANSWLNDRLSQIFCAWPVFSDTVAYRHYHMIHHRRTQQPDDPDLHLSAKFPITTASFRRKLWRDLSGQTGFKQRKAQFRNALGKPGMSLSARWSHFRRRMAKMLVANLVLLLILSAVGKPQYYLMFWLLPLLTWQQVVTRIRNIAEHAMVPDNDDVMRNARTTYAGILARAFLAPYWVNYHVDHHLLFYVPCYNLPKLHRLLLSKGLGPRMEIRPGYRDVLRLATSRMPAPAAPA
ncbi:MAG: fatty acid desaturase family protein [Rhizomicrobium sp.]